MSGRTTASQYVGVSLTGGSGYLLMTIALGGLTFTQVAWARTLLGALVLMAVAVHATGLVVPRRLGPWAHVVVLAVSNLVGPYLLLAWSQQHISSSLASVLNATTPMMTAVWATLVFRVERLRPIQVAGLVLGVAGVLLIVAPWQAADVRADTWGLVACLASTASFGFSFAYVRRFVSPLHLPGASLPLLMTATAAVIMLVLTPVLAVAPVRLDAATVAAVLVLGGVGSGLAVLWALNVVRAWGPAVASSSLYLAPVVGIVLGVAFLGEVVRPNELAGAVVTLAAVLFVQSRQRRPGTAPDGPAGL